LYLEEIRLVNFRNYSEGMLSFSPGVNVFVGDNAQGKTNLLESVHVLSTSRSHRAFSDRDLVLWGQEECSVSGIVMASEIRHQITVRCSLNYGKSVEIDGKRARRSSELTPILATIVFSPEDLQVIKGSPSLRRRFLDNELIQISHTYRHSYREYTKALQQKNSILRRNGARGRHVGSDLAVWDEQIVEHGTRLIALRVRAVAELRRLSEEIYATVSGGAEKLELNYTSTVIDHETEDEGEIKEAFFASLDRTFDESIGRGTTVVGPHRDDLAIYVGGKDIRSFGSQGQQRTAILAMKMAMLQYVQNCIGDVPVLLLDDVMSELDEKRRRYLLSVVSDRIQTFITTTSPDIGSAISDSPVVYRIEEGRASRC
jgi:DNA replication and repair protein RecF